MVPVGELSADPEYAPVLCSSPGKALPHAASPALAGLLVMVVGAQAELLLLLLRAEVLAHWAGPLSLRVAAVGPWAPPTALFAGILSWCWLPLRPKAPFALFCHRARLPPPGRGPSEDGCVYPLVAVVLLGECEYVLATGQSRQPPRLALELFAFPVWAVCAPQHLPHHPYPPQSSPSLSQLLSHGPPRPLPSLLSTAASLPWARALHCGGHLNLAPARRQLPSRSARLLTGECSFRLLPLRV
jgi:hypothetical protein